MGLRTALKKEFYLHRCSLAFFFRMLLFMAIFAAGPFTENAMADTTATLQPGPGLNNGADDGSANAGKDAGFTEVQPWGRNDGDGHEGGGMALFNSTCNIGVYPAYLQFAMTGMPTQNIVRAEIKIYTQAYFNGNGWPWPAGTYQISLRRVTSAWGEMTVTRGNEPTYNSTIIDFETFTTTGGSGTPFYEFQGWMTFDITDLYKGWANGSISNYGVILNLDTQFCTNGDVIRIFSSDYTDNVTLRPKLVVTTTQPQITAPSALTATASSSSQIVLAWNDNSDNETGFLIEQKLGDCSSTNAWQEVAITSANANTYTISGLPSDTTYAFRIRAYQTSTYSAYSNCASAKTKTGTQTWYKDADHDGYSDGTSTQSANRPENHYLASELTATSGDCNDNDAAIHPGATEICGDSKDNNCNNQTDEGCTQNITAPSALTAQASSSTQITLGWTDNSNNETGFKIEKKTGSCGSTGWTQAATKTANSTTHTVSGLKANTTYSFRVRAYKGSSNSTYSNCASTKTALSKTPPSPANLKATSASSTAVNLTWNDNSTNETGFKIYRKTGSGKWVLLTTTKANVKSFSDTTASNNSSTKSYQYYVIAYNDSGNSANSLTATVPYQPANLTAAKGSTAGSIKLAWTDKSANETGFEIYRKSGNCSSSSAWAKITATGPNISTWTDTGLTSGSTYAYKIRAYAISGSTLSAYGYSDYSSCASAGGSSSDENTPTTTISGPGGSTIKTPVGGLNGGATITIGETSDSSGLIDDGEKLVSKVLTITTTPDEGLFGDGTFSVSIPVDKSKITDSKKLELKVKLTTGVSYPSYGVYDTASGSLNVELSGVKNGWKIAVAEESDLKIIRVSSGKTPSVIGAAWITDQDWKTFEWAVVNHTNMSEADIKANILPVLWDTSEKLSKAGFRSPKIYIDPRLSPPARVVHLINNNGNHFAAGTITFANGTWIYTEDQATFSTTLLDDEQLSALGQMYVNYDQFLNLNAQYGVSLGNIVIHELFHGVQHGYDIRKTVNSYQAYFEGTATPLGQTYQNTGGSVTGPSVSVRVLQPNQHARLYQAVDDPTKPLFYTKQDFFAYVTKRYASNSFAWTDQLFEYMNTWTAGKFGLTNAQYRELYRKATDDTFGALFSKGLSKIFYEYALDRAYEHGPNSVLRPAEETEQNGFGQNHLAKTLFQWGVTDTNGLKEFDPEVNASIQFPKIEPLSCYAFYMRLPDHSESEAADGFPLVFKLEGGQVLSSGDGGIKIVAFLEDAYEDMVTDGKIAITDVSKPVLIPFKEDAVYLTVLIMNCYVENKNVKVTVSAGPYIESATPNPAEKGDEVTLQGTSFGAAQGTSKLYFGGDEMSEITSWSNTEIIFTLPSDAESGKVKVVVNSIASNEVQLDVEGQSQGTPFSFLQTWSKHHAYYSWNPEAATINFSANVSGQVVNAQNPKITFNNFTVDNGKIVEVSNMKPNEEITVSGTVNMTLSAYTISPGSPTKQTVYTYSNPKLVRYEKGVLKETYPGMNFSWKVTSNANYSESDLYVEYDIEQKYYSRESESDPFTYDETANYKDSQEFHLKIEINKDKLY